MLTVEEAIKQRVAIEELYDKHAWSSVRAKAEELANFIQLCIDRGTTPPFVEVGDLCALILRTEKEAYSRSWEDVETEIKTRVRAAADAEMKARKR